MNWPINYNELNQENTNCYIFRKQLSVLFSTRRLPALWTHRAGKLKKPVTQILSALRAFPCYFPLKEENPPTIKPLPACHAVPELPDNSAETTNSVLAELLQRCRPVHTVRRSKRQVFWLRDRHTVFVFPAHGTPVTC